MVNHQKLMRTWLKDLFLAPMVCSLSVGGSGESGFGVVFGSQLSPISKPVLSL